MNINWDEQPSKEHIWINHEAPKPNDLSGWYKLDFHNRDMYISEDGFTRIPCHNEGRYFTLHSKPEQYMPKVGEWCETAGVGAHYFYVGVNKDGGHLFEDPSGEYIPIGSLEGFRPIKTERGLLIDIILSVGNMSEGVLADTILAAGFTNKP
jgi:hypothetical protein